MTRKKFSVLAMAATFTVMTGGMSADLSQRSRYAKDFLIEGVVAEGVIVDALPKDHCKIDFQYDDASFSIRGGSCASSPIGSKARVYFLKGFPADATNIEPRSIGLLDVLFSLFVVLLFTAFAGIAGVMFHPETRAYLNGTGFR